MPGETIERAALVIDCLGGNCPVQAEGTLDGLPFYFRARGSRWSMSVGGDDVVLAPTWYHEEPYGEGPFDAGWMDREEALAFIHKAADLYRNREPAVTTPTPTGRPE